MVDKDLFLAMLGLALAAVALVAGGLVLIAGHQPVEPASWPVPAVTSSRSGPLLQSQPAHS
jgi:3-deoxy-D-manno-octulosonic-acid transferase